MSKDEQLAKIEAKLPSLLDHMDESGNGEVNVQTLYNDLNWLIAALKAEKNARQVGVQFASSEFVRYRQALANIMGAMDLGQYAKARQTALTTLTDGMEEE